MPPILRHWGRGRARNVRTGFLPGKASQPGRKTGPSCHISREKGEMTYFTSKKASSERLSGLPKGTRLAQERNFTGVKILRVGASPVGLACSGFPDLKVREEWSVTRGLETRVTRSCMMAKCLPSSTGRHLEMWDTSKGVWLGPRPPSPPARCPG